LREGFFISFHMTFRMALINKVVAAKIMTRAAAAQYISQPQRESDYNKFISANGLHLDQSVEPNDPMVELLFTQIKGSFENPV